MITYTQVIASYPQFGNYEQASVENAIASVKVETGCYEGLGNIELQQQALMLHVAHYLTVSKWDAEDKPGPVKNIRSNNDAIEFAISDVGVSFNSTQYGVRLQALLRRANTVFAVC